MPYFMEMMADLAPQGQTVGLEALEEWSTWIVVSSLLTMLVAGLLLFSGIFIVKHRRRGVKLGRTWAICKMLFVVVSVVMTVFMQRDQFEQMSQQITPQMNQPNAPTVTVITTQFTFVMGLFAAVFGILWGWAYPVFLLIWFSRSKVRAEYSRWS